MADTWILDLEKLAWQAAATGGAAAAPPPPSSEPTSPPPPLPPPPMPPTAGHVLVPWGGNVLSIGGHTKVRTL